MSRYSPGREAATGRKREWLRSVAWLAGLEARLLVGPEPVQCPREIRTTFFLVLSSFIFLARVRKAAVIRIGCEGTQEWTRDSPPVQVSGITCLSCT